MRRWSGGLSALALSVLGACASAPVPVEPTPTSAWLRVQRQHQGEHRFELMRVDGAPFAGGSAVNLPAGRHELDFEVYRWNPVDLAVEQAARNGKVSRKVSVRHTAWRFSLGAHLEAGHRYAFDLEAWSPQGPDFKLCLKDLDQSGLPLQCAEAFAWAERLKIEQFSH